MTPLRSFFRRFREAMSRAEISIWPVTVRLDFTEDRPEPRIKAGWIERAK